MCRRGEWRAFDTRHFDGELAALEQCTECGSYRARILSGFPVVASDEQAEAPSDTRSTDGVDLPDPARDDGKGSVWGPD